MAEKSRRKLIKGLGISIPTVWAAPVIESVILPAHAETSQRYTLTLVSDPEGGQTLPRCTTLSSVVTIMPNPGVVEVLGELFCDGEPHPGVPSFKDFTDSSGKLEGSGPLDCAVGERFLIRYSYMGASDEDWWDVGEGPAECR